MHNDVTTHVCMEFWSLPTSGVRKNGGKKRNTIDQQGNSLDSTWRADEDPSLWIESFAIINLRGVSTKLYFI